jgi:hypothetical protein
MTANELTLPNAAAAAVVGDVTRYGAKNVETGGFLLAPRGEDTISIVALAGDAGITRRRDLFQLSECALDRLFAHADERDLWIPAQFHSHGLNAFMSACDVDHGLSVHGFVTTIVPYFASPPEDAAQWGWWRFGSAWTPVAPPSTSHAPVRVIAFAEDGIHGC